MKPSNSKPRAKAAHAQTAAAVTGSASAAAPAKRKILLVDDHPFMRAGLAQLLNKQTDLVVCGEAGDSSEAMAELGKQNFDIVLTDLTMPGRSGLEFIKDVLALHPKLPILVVSMHDEMLYAERVLRAGGRGYIMKGAGGENLLLAIRQILQGEVYISPKVSAKIVDQFSARKPRGSSSPIEHLSDREFEVFQLVGTGHSTRDIAERLNLSPKTVDVYRGKIKEKLNLKDATELVRYAVRWVETQNLQA
ncbi:MAG TPA: response regulator transcription factor [Opitutaceae bacterium]|nr:response regulator transcription factor [Opitutaceae bacterium]